MSTVDPALAAVGNPRCPVCDSDCELLDVVDLNKSCEEVRGVHLPLAGVPIYYTRCGNCGFCFAPDMHGWSMDEFASRIYNDQYARVDPEYVDIRPRANASHLAAMVGAEATGISHLDYGGGNGLLSRLLRESGWDSASYDPFVDRELDIASLPRVDLITAYEVFEHVPDVGRLMRDLKALLNDDGLILFSTLLSDGNIAAHQRLNWWYASPRNGHISLYSRDSLYYLAKRSGLKFGSFSQNFHVFWRSVPPWASHFLKT